MTEYKNIKAQILKLFERYGPSKPKWFTAEGISEYIAIKYYPNEERLTFSWNRDIPLGFMLQSEIRKDNSGYVYLLRADNGLCKIGKAKVVNDRVRQLEISLPYDLELVSELYAEDCTETEANLHRRFAKKRIKGEWFKLDETDIEYIKELGMAA